MLCPVTDNPASCEIRTSSRFLHAKNVSAAEIHCELRAAAYGQNVKSEKTLTQLCRLFKDGRTSVHDEERSGRPSVVSEVFVRSEVFTVVTMKNAVFWDVAPCRSCVNRRFRGTYPLHLQSRKIRERGTSVSRWLQLVPRSRIFLL
jgi:hypothetical protein